MPRSPYSIPVAIESADLASIPEGAPAYCAVDNQSTLAQLAIPDVPRWFFKPLPDTPWVAYLGEDGNKLLNLDTGLVVPIPGGRDPVPTPDGRFVSAPGRFVFGTPGIGLYSVADLLDETRRQTVSELKIPLRGVYQSPGILSEHDSGILYRFMVANIGPITRDFLVRVDASGNTIVEPVGKKRRLCRGQRLQLPMISPNGREFGAYDVDSHSTKIIRIDEGDNCPVVLDLGIATGKLSFSFDDRYVAFHLARRRTFSLKAAQVPKDIYANSVFVVDRHTRRLGRLTHNTASNAYYPAYRKDGTIVYLFKPYRGSGGRYSFVVADPARIRSWVPLAWATGKCAAGQPGCARSLALGSLWAHVCSREGKHTSPQSAALYILSLQSETCGQLVRDHWRSSRASVAKTLEAVPGGQELAALDVDTLAQACPRP